MDTDGRRPGGRPVPKSPEFWGQVLDRSPAGPPTVADERIDRLGRHVLARWQAELLVDAIEHLPSGLVGDAEPVRDGLHGLAGLRDFPDELVLAICDAVGAVGCVSQFTALAPLSPFGFSTNSARRRAAM